MMLQHPGVTGGSFLVIGEAIVDEVRTMGRSVTAHPGGSPANVALGLARLDRPVRLLTELGDDDYGRMVRSHLQASGAVVESQRTRRTSRARATLGPDGSASYDFDIGWTLKPEQADHDTTVGHVHTGSLASVLAPGASTVARLLVQHRGGTTSYDPNVRPALAGDHGLAVATVERFVALSDVVKASDEDAKWLYPHATPAEVADRWRALGPGLVVLTRGAEGALARTASDWIDIAPVAVPVVDTVGAGDAFMAAMLDGLARAGVLGLARRGHLAGVSTSTLASVLNRAGLAAAITVSRPGANPPTSAELDASIPYDPTRHASSAV